jgi:hypothetical protein
LKSISTEAEMMDQIFDWCMGVLVYWAGILGITYKEINVWVFVIIWPILTVIMLSVIVIQQRKIRQLAKESERS